jgi:hypothetical protein
MVRPLLYEVVLFLIPFFLYAVWLMGRRLNPVNRESWREGWRDAPLLALLLAAVVTTGIGLALVGHFGGAPAGSVYVPAHLENGKLVEPTLR